MKKLILIISAMILILLFNTNVKASIIDDTYTRQVQIANDNNRSFMLFDDVPTKNIQFPQSFSNMEDSYLFIPLQGQALVDNSVDAQSGSNTIITGWQQYLFVGIQVYKNGNWYTKACQVETNYIYCPLDKNASFTNIYFQTIEGISPEGAYWSIEIQLPYYADIYKTNQQAIVEQQQQTNDILNETTQYNTDINTNTKGANETIQAGQMEDQLIQQNEFNGSIMDGMAIDSSASGFIWQIMERLRGMNIAIVTIMTMALGLGVIKLVLNR